MDFEQFVAAASVEPPPPPPLAGWCAARGRWTVIILSLSSELGTTLLEISVHNL